MRSFEEFKEISQAGLNLEEQKKLWKGMSKEIKFYSIFPKRSQRERREIEKTIKPILAKIDCSQPSFFTDLLKKLKEEEKAIQEEAKERNISPVITEEAILKARIKTYQKILSFGKKDIDYCKRLRLRIERSCKKEFRQKAWKYGAMAGVAFLGAGALYKYLKKEKKEN